MGQGPLPSPSSGHGATRLLMFEVLGGWISDREQRWGDWWTVHILGLLRPYVVVQFRGETHQSDVLEVKTGVLESACNFNMQIALPLASDPGSDGDERVHIVVRDRRYVQALMRGDPLVGEADLQLQPDGTQRIKARLDLRRPDCQDTSGWIQVQYWVVEPQELKRVLAVPGEHSLRDVVSAITAILRTDEGMNLFLTTKPVPEGTHSPKAASRPCLFGCDSQGRDRDKVRKLVDSLQQTVDKSTDGATDEEFMKQLGAIARDVLTFVADNAWQEGVGEASDTMALALKWNNNFFTTLGKDGTSTSFQPNLQRFARFLSSVTLKEEDLVPVNEKGRPVSVPSRWNPGMPVPEEAVLGTGSYGSVWRARDRMTKQLFAVKRMPFAGSGVASAISQRELSVAEHLRALSHPCVVRLWSVYEHRHLQCSSLVMELCPCGDLQGQIQKAKVGTDYRVPTRALHWTAEIFLGLEYLHKTVGMLVRDVKPQNVVLAHGWRAKLTDFGMSRLASSSDGTFSFHPCVPPGSPHYVAPEVLQGIGYDYHADLYSLAVLVWVLFTGGLNNSKVPLPPCAKSTGGREGLLKLINNWKLLKEVINNRKTGAPALPSAEARDFVLKLTDRGEDHQWLTHEDVRQHPFLKPAKLPPAGDSTALTEWLDEINCTVDSFLS